MIEKCERLCEIVASRVRQVGKVESKTEELGRTRHGPTPAQLDGIRRCVMRLFRPSSRIYFRLMDGSEMVIYLQVCLINDTGAIHLLLALVK
jgi:hypothetical protein